MEERVRIAREWGGCLASVARQATPRVALEERSAIVAAMHGCGRMLAMMAMLVAEARADEGMWLFNDPPVEQVLQRHGFRIEAGWLDHLRESSVRFSTGGSGSFVSSRGLILTNHHVGAGIIDSLSREGRDLMQDGFLARTPADELPCGDLELNVLESIRDVTAEVEAAVAGEMDDQAAMMARRAVIAGLERVDEAESARRVREVVTLHRGAAYHLYEYRRFTDVRLVFAPERQIAAFGGDPDNFEFPRYCLDGCFFRAYEGGRPASVGHFLRWADEPVEEGELVFTSGHPGRTSRALTHAQVRAMRDTWLPFDLEALHRREVALGTWSERDPENRRRARGALVGTQNGRKARGGMLGRLLDPSFIDRHGREEAEFRARLRERGSHAAAESAFAEIEAVVGRQQADGFRGALLGGMRAFDSRLFGMAWTLVTVATERELPDEERKDGFRDADRVSLELDLFSEDPIYRDVERARLADSLTFLCVKVGAEDATVVRILGGKSPQDRARELVDGCGLDSLELRRALYEGGQAAIEASEDPMIVLARGIEEEVRSLQERWERDEEVLAQCQAKIVRARFDLAEGVVYPDATFSLRLSVGKVRGVEESGVPFRTTYAGLFGRNERMGGAAPFDLSARWLEAAPRVDPSVPLNFVSTNDITGGNSGSPVVDRQGRLVGLVFDGNLDSLGNDVRYDEARARAVSVCALGIVEALRSVYAAEELLEEIGR